MQEGVESASELVVSGGEAAKLLEAIEESLDEVARFIAMPINGTLGFSITPRGNDRFCAGVLNGINQFVAVVAFVGNNSFGVDSFNKRSTLGDIRDFTAGKNQTQGIAQRIDACMNLGCQSASRTTDRLIATVFFGAPAACWWARTIVGSVHSSRFMVISCLLDRAHGTANAERRAMVAHRKSASGQADG